MNAKTRASESAVQARIGCAGWALTRNAAGGFAQHGSHLERYAQVFSCVEINSSFYRPHQSKTYARWAASVREGFRFSVKMPREITHTRRLQGCDKALDAFLAAVVCLGDKLGYLLVQLPPSLALDVDVASTFLRSLRDRTPVPVALEARHASWFGVEGDTLMRLAEVDGVLAHPAPVPPVDVASPSAYWRLHGAPKVYYSAYDDAFIQSVAQQIRTARTAGSDVWCIFDNTAAGEAIPNALSLMRVLAGAR